jgi:hypothetical protein
MNCPRRPTCDLHFSISSPTALRRWLGDYCDGPEHRYCARYQMFEKGEPVPAGMLPNGYVLNLAR